VHHQRVAVEVVEVVEGVEVVEVIEVVEDVEVIEVIEVATSSTPPSDARRSCSVTSCWLPGLAEMSTPQ
jgi:hypothetical protein